MPNVPQVPDPTPFLDKGADPVLLYVLVMLATVIVVLLGIVAFFLGKTIARADKLSDRLMDNTLATRSLEVKVESKKATAVKGA